jgi:hypothetical protein
MHSDGRPVPCPSCGRMIEQSYCGNCGERKSGEHDFSLMHLAEETIEGFTHFDNKLFRSLKILVTKPGLITKYHFEGRRVPYMKPLQLFIVCNILFFFLLGHRNLFSLSFSNYKDFSPYTSFGTHQAIASKAPSLAAMEEMAIRFNEQMGAASKTFLILFIPFLSIFMALFFINKKKYFAEHIVFATHYFSFLLLYFIALHFLVEIPFRLITQLNYNSTFDVVTMMFSLLILSAYFVRAARRYYVAGMLQSVLSGVFIAIVFTFCIFGYRMFLFYKILQAL